MTYTIVIDAAADLLAACVPDGDQDAISRELRDYRDQSSLTDEEPEDEGRIVWRGHERGWLSDAAGTTYQYAVRTWAIPGLENVMITKEAKKLKPGDRVVIFRGTGYECQGRVATVGNVGIRYEWDDGEKGVIHIDDHQNVERL
jgi:hypothetical protein